MASDGSVCIGENFVTSYDPSSPVTETKATCSFLQQYSNLDQGIDTQTYNKDVSNFRWSHPSAKLLISLYGRRKAEFDRPGVLKLTIWKKIATEMINYGFDVTWTICEKKWRNLKLRYRRIDESIRSGRKQQTSWQYFDSIDNILAGDVISNTSAQNDSVLQSVYVNEKKNEKVGSFTWSHKAVMMLIDLCGQHLEQFYKPDTQKQTVWKAIADDLNRNNHHVKWVECQRKWRTMKMRYNIVADNLTRTSRPRKLWGYFDAMSEILKREPGIRRARARVQIKEKYNKYGKFRWIQSAVDLLISLYRKHREKFSRLGTFKKTVWKVIAAEMNTNGYCATGADCEIKWRNLRIRYRVIAADDNRNTKGNCTWKYFDALYDIFEGDTVQTPHMNNIKQELASQDTTNNETSIDQSLENISYQLQANDSVPSEYASSLNIPSSSHFNNKLHEDPLLVDTERIVVIKPISEETSEENLNDRERLPDETNNISNSQVIPGWFQEYLTWQTEENSKRNEELRTIHRENLALQRENNRLLSELNETMKELLKKS